MTKLATPIAAVNASRVSKFPSSACTLLSTSPWGAVMPMSFGTSPMMTRIVSPMTNPVTIGLDRNSATHPTFSRPVATSTSPAPNASATVYATACSSFCGPRLATSEPDSTDTVDTGPTTSCGEDPIRA